MMLDRVVTVERVFNEIISYLGDQSTEVECTRRFSLQHVSHLFDHVLNQSINSKRSTNENIPFIYYEPTRTGRLNLTDHPSGGFKLVDSLLLPAGNSAAPRVISLSMQHQDSLFDCRPSVAYFSDSVGWGVKSGAVIPKNKLLFAYYGEFISTSEAEKRHAINDQAKVIRV